MTAEAWVCRQFLGVGGPGPASTEAAAYLLEHGPDRDPYNLYYWYYGTLAMYQHGGDAWRAGTPQVRDQIVRRQRVKRPPGGQLGPRRQHLRGPGGPDLLHRPGHPDPGGLLPLPPALRRAEAPPAVAPCAGAVPRPLLAADRDPGSLRP